MPVFTEAESSEATYRYETLHAAAGPLYDALTEVLMDLDSEGYVTEQTVRVIRQARLFAGFEVIPSGVVSGVYQPDVRPEDRP